MTDVIHNWKCITCTVFKGNMLWIITMFKCEKYINKLAFFHLYKIHPLSQINISLLQVVLVSSNIFRDK